MNTYAAKKQEIVEKLAWNNSEDANDVNISGYGNTSTLSGAVLRYATKMTAENETYLVDGIKNLCCLQWMPH